MVDADVKITIPSSDAKMVDLTNWAGPNNYKYETQQVVDASKAGKTEVQYNGQNVSGQTISVKQSQLGNISFKFIEYVAPTPTCGANASLVNGACVCNSGYEGDPNTGCTPIQTPSPSPSESPTPSTEPSTSPSPDTSATPDNPVNESEPE